MISVILFLVLLLIPLPASSKQQVNNTIANWHISNENVFGPVSINNWLYWIRENGLAVNPYTGSYAGAYRNFNISLVYHDGIVWGTKLKDSQTGQYKDSIYVAGITFRSSMQPGAILKTGENVQIDPASKGIFLIHKEWQKLSFNDLVQLASILNNVPVDQVTKEMASGVRELLARNWKNWPVENGAPFYDINKNGVYDPILDENGYAQPEQGDYPGIANADEVLYFVTNDLEKAYTLYHFGVMPAGVELQTTIWAYQRKYGYLNDVIFKRYVLKNFSNYILDSLYLSVFSDPDVGDYSDDLVGCDTTLNLMFAYNGEPEDIEFQKYNLNPASVGYVLLQGPAIYSGNLNDTAIVNFKHIAGYKNLPMTSFNYFSSSSSSEDPPMGDYDYALIWYNMMRGFAPTNDIENPISLVIGSGPEIGRQTRFPLSGDPVNDPQGLKGDVDGAGNNSKPGDRRMLFSSGPITINPGESQEIVIAMVMGIGKTRLESVKEVKITGASLHQLHNNLYKIYKPPAPDVRAVPFDDKIVLNWGWNLENLKKIENNENFKFEGYNIYQLPDSISSINGPKSIKIATFDLKNGIRTIFARQYVPELKGNYPVPVQEGSDSGIKHYFVVEKDYIHNRPLFRGSTYYFAVTSYTYNPYDEAYASIESDVITKKVTVQGPKPGSRYMGKVNEYLSVKSSMETTDVSCFVKVIDPSKTTGHSYKINFSYDNDSTSSTYGEIVWNVEDLDENKVLLQQMPLLHDNLSEEAPIVDGLLITVVGPEDVLKAIVEVANANGPLGPSDYDAAGAPYGGNYVWHSLSAPTDANRFYISAGGGVGEMDLLLSPEGKLSGHDFELRFTDAGGLFVWWKDDSNKVAATVPFEAWDVGPGTYSDTTDDVRCLTGGYSGGETVGVFDFTYVDPAFGFLSTDWIDFRKPLNPQGSYQAFEEDVLNGNFTYNWWNFSKEVLRNIIICDFGGARTLPPTGTVIRFISAKGPEPGELHFTFTAPARIENDLELMKKDVEKINVFPNPYYTNSSQEPDRFTHFVTFNHLPPHAIFRIFTLNGVLVRKLEKNDQTQFFRWDLKNERGWPVASGLYIIHIDMPELKKQKILKLMVISGEEVLDYY